MIQLAGEYVSEYAIDYINTYASYSNTYDCSVVPAYWTGGTDGAGTFHVCCSTGVQYMFQHALGIDIQSLGVAMLCTSYYSNTSNYTVITSASELQAGDILTRGSESGLSGHMELYIGNNQTANFGHGGSDNLRINTFSTSQWPLGSGAVALRLTSSVDVTPSGTVPSSSSSSVNLSNFYFNGIPDGKYSVAHTNILTWIINTLAEIADYLIGLLTYLFRIPFIGWTAIFDNLLNWTVNSVTDTGVTEDDIGISSIEVEGADDENRLTIETLVYNEYKLTDINIFK